MKITGINLTTYNNSIQFNMFKNEEYHKMRELVENLLATSKQVKVKFTKVDGSVRDMVCTRDSTIIPPQEPSTRKKKENPTVCSVWDVEANGWRSFRYDSVISAEGL